MSPAYVPPAMRQRQREQEAASASASAARTISTTSSPSTSNAHAGPSSHTHTFAHTQSSPNVAIAGSSRTPWARTRPAVNPGSEGTPSMLMGKGNKSALPAANSSASASASLSSSSSATAIMPSSPYRPPGSRNANSNTYPNGNTMTAPIPQAYTHRTRNMDSWPEYDSPARPSSSSSSTTAAYVPPRGDSRNRNDGEWDRDRYGHGPRSGPGAGAGAGDSSLNARTASGPGRARVENYTSPTLYVFGDSFVGPMKLLSNDSARCTTYKGASAKGLNNPHSAKQVAAQLVPALERLIAPAYGYVPSSGRWALLIFGNVDLQINYLWQLQHKALSSSSFPPGSKTPYPDSTSDVDADNTAKERVNGHNPNATLAIATETSLSGHALGPKLFVDAILKAYTSFLEREIVNGRIGQLLRARAEARRAGGPWPRDIPKDVPGKILVAGALPPLIQDEYLHRIPEKYVERLEDEHEKAQKALAMSRARKGGDDSGERTGAGLNSQGEADGAIVASMRKLDFASRPATPRTAIRASGISTNTATDNGGTESTYSTPSRRSGSDSVSTAPSSLPSSPDTSPKAQNAEPSSSHPGLATASGSRGGNGLSGGSSGGGKKSIESLLLHDPPLCTLPVRVRMTREYNSRLRAFIEQYPDIFDWIDISHAMLKIDRTNGEGWESDERRQDREHDIVDRSTWACPVDPTNVHPLWEPTLPLWMEKMKWLGVPTEGFRMDEAAEDTLKAYEEDKKRRTANREREWAEEKEAREAAGPATATATSTAVEKGTATPGTRAFA